MNVGSFYRNSTALQYLNEQYYENNNLWSRLLLSQFSGNTNYEQLSYLNFLSIVFANIGFWWTGQTLMILPWWRNIELQ